MSKKKIVVVSGGLASPSKTTALATEILNAASSRINAESRLIEVAFLASSLGGTLRRDQATPLVSQALASIEDADLLIAATPVYRGSFAGHFKVLFDLIELTSLRGVPVILAATGGSERHSLVLDHALRPLFAFFEAFSLPTGVYASERDFESGVLQSHAVKNRIQVAVGEAVDLLNARASAAEPYSARIATSA